MRKGKESFGKAEHLCGLTTINNLFDNGRSISFRFFRVVYLISEPCEGLPPVRMLVSVPKRNFKRAVDRNLLKRRLRESYRRNKATIVNSMVMNNKRIDFAVLWTDRQIIPYDEIYRVMEEMVTRLSEQTGKVKG